MQPEVMLQTPQQQMGPMSDEDMFAMQQQQLFQQSMAGAPPQAQFNEMPPEMQQALLLQ